MDLRELEFDRTQDHWWWRPGWGPGTRYLTYHLTFEDAPALHGEAERLAPRLGALDHVDVVPVPWLHLTMTGAGFSTDLGEEQVAELVRALDEDLAVRPLVFDELVLSSEALFLSARRSPWIDALKARQEAAVGRIDGPPSGQRFYPHVSLAYFSGEVDVAAVREAVRDAREVEVAAPRHSLIELGRDDRVYTWRVLAQKPLDGR